ncbi:hypothetical protein [Shinella zoogloeoides]|uniref:hypothetical protein n=1 Tax=Shinella zoogloeoides TaxID=352475 RepID=UPI00299F3481|nr:hypothetical protein [Shinella zoogloeoides]WPE23497.1 hypothetical protein ShzoTeo12_47170 [Shinella zoogloeoides]
MTQPTFNILPFPIHRSPPVMTVPATSDRAAEVAAVAPVDVSAEDYAALVESVVKASVHFARRKGVRLDSLPPQLRSWLLDLCDQGDPTCRVVHEWLTGNRRFCRSLSGEDV